MGTGIETAGQMLRVGIVGSREFNDLRMVRRFVNELPNNAVVVSGGARGVDQAAADEAEKCQIETDIKYPNKSEHGIPAAYFVRNQEIVDASHWIVAFWDGESTGTKDTIEKAREAGKPVNIYIRK